MSVKEVKTEVIRRGLFTLDATGPQLKAILLRALSAESASAAAAASASSRAAICAELDDDDVSPAAAPLDGVAVAKAILAAVGNEDVVNVLMSFPAAQRSSIQNEKLSTASSRTTLAKVKRGVAILIHPDKLKRFPQAKEGQITALTDISLVPASVQCSRVSFLLLSFPAIFVRV